jgi:septum site-determining protein MinC
MIKTESFQLKADFMPLTVFKFVTPDMEAFRLQLAEAIRKAPKYFIHAPVLLDVQDLVAQSELDFITVCSELRANKILPIGIKGLVPELHSLAVQNGLAIVNASAKKQEAPKQAQQEIPEVIPEVIKENSLSRRATKVITAPVRSGTQVYAPDGDLIILAAVNAGAEVIADGNVHVYGALRGRALAGAKGDKAARIFCRSLQAELISIAGCYLVKENLSVPPGNHAMVQIYLEDQHINIEGV